MQKIMQKGLVPATVSVSSRPGGGSNLAYVYLNQFTNSADSLKYLDAQAKSYRGILAELGLTKR